ncbi:unnamed protein product [Heterobilharzia americana]|nr:unnamed protein product [Heterobilharzia americana]
MQKSYQCDKCKHFFPTPSYHAYHQKLCGSTYSCSVCFRSYSSKKHLLQHCRRSGHSNTISSSVSETKVASSLSRRKCPPVSSSNITYNHVHMNTCAPIVLPLLILPIPVPGVSALNMGNVDNNIIECLNMNSFLYTSALSALSSMSAQIPPSSTVQVSLPESPANSSGSSVVLKPGSEGFFNLYRVSDATLLSSEASTQTDKAYVPVTFTQPNSHIVHPQELVSVNTCTDEDDISSFIGGLFCNAAVEANFSPPHTIDGPCGVKPKESSPTNIELFTLSSFNECQLSTEKSIENSVQTSNYNLLVESFSSGVDQEIQTRLLPLCENASMQTDVVKKLNAEVATHYPHVDRSTYFAPNRMLETPPPPIPLPQSTVSLGTHLSTACQTLHRLLSESKGSDEQPSTISLLDMNTSINSGACADCNLLNYGYDLPNTTDSVLRFASSAASSSIKTSVTTSTMSALSTSSRFCNLNSSEATATTQHDGQLV